MVSIPPPSAPTTTVMATCLRAAALAPGDELPVMHCHGSMVGWVVAQMAHLAPSRDIVVLCPDRTLASRRYSDVVALGGQSLTTTTTRYVGMDDNPYEQTVINRRQQHERIQAVSSLAPSLRLPSNQKTRRIVVADVASFITKTVPPERVQLASYRAKLGDTIDRDGLAARLVELGYLRVPLVEDPGTFAIRGGLLDVWSPGEPAPIRLSFDGDEIDRIRTFAPESQKTQTEVTTLMLLPASLTRLDAGTSPGGVGARGGGAAASRLREICDRVNWPTTKTNRLVADLLDGLPVFGQRGFLPAFEPLMPIFDAFDHETLVVLDEPTRIADAAASAIQTLEEQSLERHKDPHFEPDAFAVDTVALGQWLDARAVMSLHRAPIAGQTQAVAWRCAQAPGAETDSLAATDQQSLQRLIQKESGSQSPLSPLCDQIERWLADAYRVGITAQTVTQAERIATLLRNRDLDVAFDHQGSPLSEWCTGSPTGAPQSPVCEARVFVAGLAHGLVAPSERVALVTNENIFGTVTPKKRRKSKKTKGLTDDFRSLRTGDYVVHIEHGIGRYEGLSCKQLDGREVEMLMVSYAKGDRLFLPVYRLNQIHKYSGGDAKPKLDRLGGQTFQKTKGRAAKKAREMADELLSLYASRKAQEGFAVDPPGDDYRAFEAAFPFTETDDQLTAIEDVGLDLEDPSPMDRLICGDVGFGKTEVALRAAFRVAMSGRQVAILCPTTVLAQQHHLNFTSRFRNTAAEVGLLSRFQTKKQNDAVVQQLRKGTLDVVIGTHRLLSKDVHFSNLGLLVVDEEQRFGVAAKERIKALRSTIDVLTLSATPIPRTLQMAVAGLRDLSLITTPPTDRRAVRTIVTRYDEAVVRDAVTRELERGGQCYVVYNRVTGLQERANMIQRLVPQARVAMAHGKMRAATLERTMVEFVEGQHDVLCATAIIENGLDIPRCNTIIIDRPDLFGLGQLYQLRGRVGRSSERAYCYLVLPPGGDVTEDARARIEAIQQFQELGSGFQIASLDLDLRGGGDLLGGDQSGTVATVGLAMFSDLLHRAVEELRGQPVSPNLDTELSFDVEAVVPSTYVEDVGLRLSLYKRMADAPSEADVQTIAAEMEDRFGRPPPAVRRLVQLMTLKPALRRIRALACEATSGKVTLHLRDDTPVDPVRLAQAIASATADGTYRLTPDMRLSRRSGEGEVFASGIESCTRMLHELADLLRD